MQSLKAPDSAIAFEACKSWVGTDRSELAADGEGPVRKVSLKRFAIDRCAVSVERFGRFVAETGYLTDAERLEWSFVFRGLITDPACVEVIGHADRTSWWWGIRGANWRFPTGEPDKPADPLHPATQLSWNDATAFARWVGGRLPTEAEWEHAARGGTANIRYPWGNDEPDDDAVFCNIWQGRFPETNSCKDGYYGTAPVDAFAPNAAGLYNMSGNVWEWTADPYRVRSLKSASKKRNEAARRNGDRVMKGGSFLCHASYCWRYRIAARSGRPRDTGASHSGFRVAYGP